MWMETTFKKVLFHFTIQHNGTKGFHLKTAILSHLKTIPLSMPWYKLWSGVKNDISQGFLKRLEENIL